MKVRDLIQKLSQFDGDKEVYLTYQGDDGCDTCGYGATTFEDKDFDIKDMESKIWLSMG